MSKEKHVLVGALLTAVKIAALLACATTHAGERWTRVANVEAVTITVELVTVQRLTQLMYTKTPDMRSVRRSERGRAVLKRNIVTGAYTCTIYVTKPEDRETLAHEERHCYGWTHN